MADVLRKVVGVFKFKDEASKNIDKVDKSITEAKNNAGGLNDALKAFGGAKTADYIKNMAIDFLVAGADAEERVSGEEVEGIALETQPEIPGGGGIFVRGCLVAAGVGLDGGG